MSRSKGNISFASIDLGAPLWAIEWHPFDGRTLFTGGGGGGGQKEVPNKLAVVDTSSRHALKSVAELQLTDDSLSSLGVLATERNGSLVFGQVNSSKADRDRGVNDHLRSFEVKLSSLAKKEEEKTTTTTTGSIREVGKARLFSETYIQSDGFGRLLRLSPVRSRSEPSKRIGVVASSLAPEAELVVFDATKSTPAPIQKVKVASNKEANDVDIFQAAAPGSFSIAYATAYELYSFHVTLDPKTMRAKRLEEPACICTSVIPDAFAKKVRAKYRSLRFLSENLLLLLVNIGSASELQIVRLLEGSSEVVLRKRLPKSVGSAVSLDVQLLDADSVSGERQAIVAVAAQAKDVMLYTLDLVGDKIKGTFQAAGELPVADVPLKQVRIQPFFGGSSSIQVASISLSNILVVDTLPLFQPKAKQAKPRYVLTKPGGGSNSAKHVNIITLGFMLLMSLLLAQSYFNQQSSGSIAPQFLPVSWQKALIAYRERALEMSSPLQRRVDQVSHSPAGQKILDVLHAHHSSAAAAASSLLPGTNSNNDNEDGNNNDNDDNSGANTITMTKEKKKTIVLTANGETDEISHETHDDHDVASAHIAARDLKTWEQLSSKQQARWREKMRKTGSWSAELGETLFKGVFFSEIAGAVGRAAAEALN